jgi:hypothetical protein
MNKGHRIFWVVGLFGASVTAICYGDGSSTTAQIPASGDAVKAGDIIKFRSAAPIFDESFGSAPATELCAPPRSVFEVQSISTAPANGAKSSAPSSAPVPVTTQIVYGAFPTENWFQKFLHLFPNQPSNQPAKTPNSTGPCNGYVSVSADVPYKFDASNLGATLVQRGGFTWGALVIPYKYYFTDKSFKGNPSTVAFAGYEGWFPGVSLALVGSAGIGVAPSSSSPTSSSGAGASPSGGSTPTSSNDSSTSATYTVALGAIATFGGSMKAGLMCGRDYQSNASGFKYNNKTWLALSIGTSF